MHPPEPEIVTTFRAVVEERPALVPAMLIALHERDERIAELEATTLKLTRDNHRLRLGIAAYRKLTLLPRPILDKIAAEIAAKG